MAAHERSSRMRPVQENMPLQIVGWRVERIGWYLLLGLMVLALSGVFARGPFGMKTVSSDALQVTYPRFARYGAPVTLVVRNLADSSRPALSVTLANEWVEGFSFESIQPAPQASLYGREGLHLRFLAVSGPGQVVFRLKADAFGRVTGWLSAGDQRVELSTFVYP